MTKKLSTFFRTHGWCQGALARGESGRRVHWYSPAAKSFCLSGACLRLDLPICDITDFIQHTYRLESTEEWNDARRRTKAQVIAMCEKFEKSQRKKG